MPLGRLGNQHGRPRVPQLRARRSEHGQALIGGGQCSLHANAEAALAVLLSHGAVAQRRRNPLASERWDEVAESARENRARPIS